MKSAANFDLLALAQSGPCSMDGVDLAAVAMGLLVERSRAAERRAWRDQELHILADMLAPGQSARQRAHAVTEALARYRRVAWAADLATGGYRGDDRARAAMALIEFLGGAPRDRALQEIFRGAQSGGAKLRTLSP